MQTHIPALDDERFAAEVLNCEGAVLVVYVSDHCIWCDRQMPLLLRVAQEDAARLRVFQVNAQLYPATLPRDGIRATPTLALYRDGQLLMTKSGLQRPQALQVFIDHYLAADV